MKSVQDATKRLREGVANPARAVSAVVTDLTVIGGTGLDVVAAIRGLPETAGIPIIIVSASDDPENAQKCVSCGADAFLSKDNLVQQLAAWVNRATAGQVHSKAA